MEKKYFYVDNLHEYGKRLYYKKHSLNWKFVQLSKKAFGLYNERTGKIVMSRKHPKDKSDMYIAFAICYHKYMGWAEPKEKGGCSFKDWRNFLFGRIGTTFKMLWPF